jgi:hypothetical protein
MSQIITNVSAGRKFILPTGKTLILGQSTKANAKILSDSYVKKLISSGKLAVSSTETSVFSIVNEVVDVVKEVAETVALSAVNPIAAIANLADVASEVGDIIEVLDGSSKEIETPTESITEEDLSKDLAVESEVKQVTKRTRSTAKKESQENG